MNNENAPSIAVIGGGYWGKNLVRNFHALGALHTICDVDEGTLEDLAAKHVGVRTTTDIDKVLSDQAIEAIAIATPAVTHGALVRRVLESDKDVYVEKPLCLSISEGEELSGLALSLIHI